MKLKKIIIDLNKKDKIINLEKNILEKDIFDDNIIGFHLIINNNINFNNIKCELLIKSFYFPLLLKNIYKKHNKSIRNNTVIYKTEINIKNSINEYLVYIDDNNIKFKDYYNKSIDLNTYIIFEILSININYNEIKIYDNIDINSLILDENIIKNNNKNFYSIFNFNLKYNFDFERYKIILDLIKDNCNNNKILLIIKNSKKERLIDHKDLFLNLLFNHLECEEEILNRAVNIKDKILNSKIIGKTILNSSRIFL